MNEQQLLPSLIDGYVESFIIEEKSLLSQLTSGLGSPLHILFPKLMVDNINGFQSVYDELSVSGDLYFASKANKAETFLSIASQSNIGVDVASRGEFLSALANGIAGESIIVTGPHKGEALHKLAIAHNAIITLDSTEEYEDLKDILQDKPDVKVNVFLRYRPESEKTSRFGFREEGIQRLIAIIGKNQTQIILKGFSCHLSGYDIEERASVGFELVRFCIQARKYGSNPKVIDLGGGWPISYVGADDWEKFKSKLSSDCFHGNRCFSEYYPYYSDFVGPNALKKCLLTLNQEGNSTLAQLCNNLGLMITIEPGRALLDQAGVSIFKVRSITSQDNGEYEIITVEGKSFSLSEQWFNSEFYPAPILVHNEERKEQNILASVAADSCLDSDMLSWRKIPFKVFPKSGDLLIYINTAGYQMDSNESTFHKTALPTKISVWKSHTGWSWCVDDKFYGSSWKGGKP